jgi:hypothetical protein
VDWHIGSEPVQSLKESCLGGERERFERELKRGRYCGRMIVVVDGSLSDVVVAGRRLHHNAIIGTIAALTLRYCPFVFAGSERIAADFAFRFLAAQVRDVERVAKVGGDMVVTK